MTPTHDPTQLLIEKAREGDRAAFEALVESHRERLAARVEPRVGKHLLSRVTVEDILDDSRACRAVMSVITVSSRTFMSARAFCMCWVSAPIHRISI